MSKKFLLPALSLTVMVSIGYSARHKLASIVRSSFPSMQVVELVNKPKTQDEMIKAIVKSHLPDIMNCYNQRIAEGLDKNGQLKVSWDLDEKGRPSNFEVLTNELGDSELSSCSSQAIAHWGFPKGIPFKVSYTFHLKQKDKRGQASDLPPIVEEE